MYIYYLSLSLLIRWYAGPDSLPPVRVRAQISRESSRTLGVFLSYKIPFIKLSAENTERITRVFRLKSFLTALSTNTSINYTARAVCPSLREPTRAEWRATNLFWVPIKSQTTIILMVIFVNPGRVQTPAPVCASPVQHMPGWSVTTRLVRGLHHQKC